MSVPFSASDLAAVPLKHIDTKEGGSVEGWNPETMMPYVEVYREAAASGSLDTGILASKLGGGADMWQRKLTKWPPASMEDFAVKFVAGYYTD
mmetsp:Transcript_90006/g.226419  ORF Transcript_90006/g.226419 Transcript_90006/m.226419 type:complete len:93 (+) Transcript_90006:123-401(+)|eukprot:CAMPEP_0115312246 /NCGR_PEP_ID=MMETSP0270-20121206/75785_1 /TAXON_ID=71861 /ORGANISM="Scrippsiella trochoidea, Strain CCMP3099" /LENGTH=92 /DNA_ID=CAMNT_0002731169 /DNA_START=19 /DNA_END=297 /DNA_ORIENTATION=-